MGKQKKINPNKKVITEADLNRVKQAIMSETTRKVMAVVAIVLCDKFDGKDYIVDVWNEFLKYIDAIDSGRISLSDICDTLKREYGINYQR